MLREQDKPPVEACTRCRGPAPEGWRIWDYRLCNNCCQDWYAVAPGCPAELAEPAPSEAEYRAFTKRFVHLQPAATAEAHP